MMQPLTMKSTRKKMDVMQERAKQLLKVIIAWTIGLFLAPHMAANFFYGTATPISAMCFVFSLALLLSFSCLAYKERKRLLFDIFLIGLVTLTVAIGTSSFNNLLFNLHYGNKIKGDVNVTGVEACEDKTNSLVPYAIENNNMIILCPQTKTITGLLYKTDSIAIPSWLDKSY